MLRDLHIQNLALIDDVWLEFQPGLTVLSGETGAGKTVLLSALELIMGGRSDSGSIAPGASSAKVEAIFDAAPPADADDFCEDTATELVISRTMNTSGRTRVVINGELSTVSALQKQVGRLIDLHGQHDHQALLSPARHLDYLDRWAQAQIRPLHVAYTDARQQWQTAQQQLQQLQEMLSHSAQQSEEGRIALAEIERIDPQVGEDDQLREKLPALQNSEQIAVLMEDALRLLRGEGAALE
ncbi:MAG: AAA family ATPase, partial [Coriobacteriia bacterium]|nr:AAA family ATPase [Coriobacteriia bacterium]